MLQLPSDLAQQVTTALAEDIGGGDITAQLVPAAQRVTGQVITREEATLCGRAWVTEVFRQLDPAVQLTWHADDGDRVTANQTLFEIAGLARPVLTGERTALNFLQLLSATATATRRYVDAIAGTRCAIWDTRKTIPGLRTAQKYAVVSGGGSSSRPRRSRFTQSRRGRGSGNDGGVRGGATCRPGHHHARRIQPGRHEGRGSAEQLQRPSDQSRSIGQRDARERPQCRGNRRRLHLDR